MKGPHCLIIVFLRLLILTLTFDLGARGFLLSYTTYTHGRFNCGQPDLTG